MNKMKISTIFLSACFGFNAMAVENVEKTEKLQRELYSQDVKALIDKADLEFKKKRYVSALGLIKDAKAVLQKSSKEGASTIAKLKGLDDKLSIVTFAAVDKYVEASKSTSSSQDLESAKILLQELVDASISTKLAEAKISEINSLLEVKSIESRVSKPELEQAQEEKLTKTEPLFEQAQLLFDNKRYEDCRTVIDQILIVNPYHLEATRLLKKVYANLQEVGELRQEVTRLERLGEAEWEWVDPIKTVAIKNETTETVEDTPVPTVDDSPLSTKLESIVLPRVKFENATIEEVVEYLKKTSKKLDVEGTGVSFVYKKSEGSNEAPLIEEPEEDLDSELDVDIDTEVEEPVLESSTKDSLLTVELDNIPLNEFIRYFSSATGLRYQVDEFAVVIGKPETFTNLLKTKFYPVSPDFVTDLDGDVSADSGGFGEDEDFGADNEVEAGSTNEKTTISSLRKYFQELGVKFPKGASVSYILASSKLAVTNTDENLRQFEVLIRELNVQPNQVNIESKFVEIGQEDAEQLGFNWFVGGANSGPGGDFRFRPQSPLESGSVVGYNQSASSTASELTAGLGNILNASRDGAKFVPNLGIATVLGGTAFDVYIRAVDQTSTSDVLSAPKVTTKSGQTATLRVVTERFFPESYQVAEISTRGNSGSNFGTIAFTPSKPEYSDKPKDLGVVLEVTPTVNADGYTIKMDLRPTVLDLIGFDRTFNYTLEYNSTISQVNTTMPIFSRRSVETKVILWDGETLTIGGLNRERVESFDDGVPILKDIPFLGRLWESKGYESIKTNLLIFVTARLINPAGLPLRPNNIRGLPDYKRI